MEQFPTWMTAAISSGIVAVLTSLLTFVLTRRKYHAETSESEANALMTMTKVAERMANRLSSVLEQIPVWQQKVTESDDKAALYGKQAKAAEDALDTEHQQLLAIQVSLADCEEREPLGIEKARIIRTNAVIIAEDATHLSYLADGNGENDPIAVRFRRLKAAAAAIAAVEI